MNGEYRKTGEIHLADIIECLKALPWQDNRHAAMIVESLGFSVRQVQPEPHRKDIFDANRYPERKRTTPQQPPPRRLGYTPPTPALPVDLPAHVLPSRLDKSVENSGPLTGVDAFPWLNDAPVLYEPEPTSAPVPALGRESLFPNLVSRGILAAALATKRQSADVDVARLLADLVSARPLTSIPTTRSASLRNGCQLLLDFSANMVPYWDDLSELAKQTKAVVGEAQTEVFEFDTDPHAALHWSDRGEEVVWTIRRERPVMVATDMGIQGRDRVHRVSDAWLQFVEQCRIAKTPLLILIPWSRTYWPEDIGNYPILVHWNPSTTATMIKHKVGVGHEVPG